MARQPRHHSDLLTDLLKEVSRSFYLTLRILPRPVRRQIGLAYLLARATDTIADAACAPVATRLQALEQLRSRIAGPHHAPLDLSALLAQEEASSPSPAERILLERIEEALAVLNSFNKEDQSLIREVLNTITSGQSLDLERFGSARGRPQSLATAAELEDYTYRVAGCVGEFWTRICLAHLFADAGLDEGVLLGDGIRFGKGLQLVNILRDLPRDLRSGRCYLPGDELAAAGLQPVDLLDPASEPRLRPVFHRWLDRAESHLRAGWSYTQALPRAAVRIRLACAWPLLIGARTLCLLRLQSPLTSASPVKIRRAEVRRLLAQSLFLYPFEQAWRHQFQRALRPSR